MPLDSTSFTLPLPLDTVSRSGVQIGALGVLERALRRMPPDDPSWDFEQSGGCGSVGCAMLVAKQCELILKIPLGGVLASGFYSFLGLSAAETTEVFGRTAIYGVDWSAVTPLMVADAIATIIAREIAADSRGQGQPALVQEQEA